MCEISTTTNNDFYNVVYLSIPFPVQTAFVQMGSFYVTVL